MSCRNGTRHASMISVPVEELSDHQRALGQWWRCTNCRVLALVPAEEFAEAGSGRHRA